MKEVFFSLTANFTKHTGAPELLWKEIEKNYSGRGRHYHTLTHLQNMYTQLVEVKELIHSWDTVLFSLFYHDVVYKASQSNNEEKGAALAEKRMLSIDVSIPVIDACKQQILATKAHATNVSSDTNLFIDADLSILGLAWESYSAYLHNVRKEYAIYPDMLYNPGRKKVLHHFLQMASIFKTDHFINKFEQQARSNLIREIELV